MAARTKKGESVTLQAQELRDGDPDAKLAAWHEVYEGLSEDDVAEVEAMALDRSRFSREDPE